MPCNEKQVKSIFIVSAFCFTIRYTPRTVRLMPSILLRLLVVSSLLPQPNITVWQQFSQAAVALAVTSNFVGWPPFDLDSLVNLAKYTIWFFASLSWILLHSTITFARLHDCKRRAKHNDKIAGKVQFCKKQKKKKTTTKTKIEVLVTLSCT